MAKCVESMRAAEAALTTYSEALGTGSWDAPVHWIDRNTILVDLLTDLMHLCDDDAMSFEGALSTARMHHACEEQEAAV